jgi:plastocyanin
VNKSLLKVAATTAMATMSFVSILTTSAQAEEYTFSIENKSSRAVTQVLVSQDGNDWGYFSLTKTVQPGTTATMVWGEHTNHEACVQWIKIGYEDGTMTEATKFDFCKNPDLEVSD